MAERIVRPDPSILGEDFDPDDLLPERKGSRKEVKVWRRTKAPVINKRKNRDRRPGRLPQAEWEALVASVFGRSGWHCERCGVHNQERRLDPHHRKLTGQGGLDEAVNLAALCRRCHDWCHGHPVLAQAGGWIVPSWADPEARAMLLHTGELVQLDTAGGYAGRWRP